MCSPYSFVVILVCQARGEKSGLQTLMEVCLGGTGVACQDLGLVMACSAEVVGG
jgi:hypothetical protein